MSAPTPGADGPALFAGTFSRGAAAAAVSGAAWLRALLDVEGAVARAAAACGAVPATAADAIGAACRDVDRYDAAALGAEGAAAANPVVPLVRAIEAVVGEAAGRYVHFGATSQDVLDTAAMLVARRALAPVADDLAGAATAAARLAREHRDTAMSGRTLLMAALPTTFGLKAAGWMAGLDAAVSRLRAVGAGLPVQYAGAVGTLAASDGHGLAIRRALGDELGLQVLPLPWHTTRLPVADLAGALGTAAGIVAGAALDVVLLAQSEVGEVREGVAGRGGSSAMPHKRNAVAAISARACAHRVPGLTATLFAGLAQEHERGAGPWQAEWETLSDLLRLTGSSAAWLRDCLEHLEVDVAAMRRNAQVAADAARAADLAAALAPTLGRARAHDLVAAGLAEAAADGVPVERVLSARLAEEGLDVPAVVAGSGPAARAAGEAAAQVDAALAARDTREVDA